MITKLMLNQESEAKIYPQLALITVTEFSMGITKLLATRFPLVQVKGEVSGLKKDSKGHMYFSLREPNDSIAATSVNCAFWLSKQTYADKYLKDGDLIVVLATPELFQRTGSFQLIIKKMLILGTGNLQLAFELMKDKLMARGLFDEKHKKLLPKFPEKIAIITSNTGSVIHDMLAVFNSKNTAIEISILHTQVQGGSMVVQQIIRTLKFADKQDFDLLILARGGGSMQELFVFNDEALAKAIFNLHTPIISAIGHEPDYVISDFVASKRAATPTQAASIAVEYFNKQNLLKMLDTNFLNMRRALHAHLQELLLNLQKLSHKLSSLEPFNNRIQVLVLVKYKLINVMNIYINHKIAMHNRAAIMLSKVNLLHRIQDRQQMVDNCDQQLINKIHLVMTNKTYLLNIQKHKQLHLSPFIVLQKGYSIAYLAGISISSIQQLSMDDTIDLRLSDGIVKLKVIGL